LRPSGNQGTLVCSLGALIRYHERDAAVWERQILLRARPVAGPIGLRDAFEAVRLDVLAKPLPEGAAQEIHHIRQRMEMELAKETSAKRDFKLGRGGLLDVETIVQRLQLVHGREHRELWDVVPLRTQLERLGALGLLPREHAADLGAGWEFLQRLSARLRVVENRSISDLDAERGDLESVARSLGYTSKGQPDRASGREGGARRALLADYRRHTERIREIYRGTFEVVAREPPAK
jgi:glutamate-ammonia-ligase adenylyltransferase